MDILSANASNIESVAVTCGYAKEEILLEYTDNIAKSALEAVKFITLCESKERKSSISSTI
jgi:phosphoglycolate phosphatase-like HAD superfamily hydrolase